MKELPLPFQGVMCTYDYAHIRRQGHPAYAECLIGCAVLYKGNVYVGRSTALILERIKKNRNPTCPWGDEITHGFYTGNNYMVTVYEARAIAKKAGQLPMDFQDKLTGEVLWPQT